MNDKTQKRIDCYFDKLTDYINKLPVPVKVRNIVWIESYSEFYDNLSPSECGKNNNGIKTIWQLQRFDEQFKKNIEKLRLRAVEKFTDELNRIEPSEALDIIEKQLHELKQKELLAEIGADSLNDWQIWCEKYLSYQLVHQQKRPTRKLPKQQKRTTYQWQGNPDKELAELYSLMINKHKLIASETTIDQFTAIFTGQSIDNIKPIKWQHNGSVLLYLIYRLEQSGNIVHNPKKSDYQKMTACFVKPDGQKFEANWKSLKTNIEISLSLANRNTIDNLVSEF